MTNTLSPYFTDEDLVAQLSAMFEENVRHTFDYKRVFHEIDDVGDCLQLKFRGRVFNIDKVTGDLTEVEVG